MKLKSILKVFNDYGIDIINLEKLQEHLNNDVPYCIDAIKRDEILDVPMSIFKVLPEKYPEKFL